MANQGLGKGIVFAALGLSVVGLAMSISTPAYATETWLKKVKRGKVPKSLKDAATRFAPDVVASAVKWAKARKLPLADVLATILLESRGDPKAHALSAKEDSRGSMQVNVRAWHDLITKLGYQDDDLYRLDVGIEVGTAILASYRAKVQALVDASKVPQFHDLSTLTRLYYAGPKYVDKMVRNAKTTADTAHPYKDSEVYVSHWRDAINAVNAVYIKGAYA